MPKKLKENKSKTIAVNWNVVYSFLIAQGILMIAAFYWFTKAFE